jgi:hypothetical protein
VAGGFCAGAGRRFGDALDEASDLLICDAAALGARQVTLRNNSDATILVIHDRHAPYLPFCHDLLDIAHIVFGATATGAR